MPRSATKARPLEANIDIPTKEDLQEVLTVCDPLEKAILLVGVSSGLSANEIRSLKVKDFKAGYDPETGVTTLRLRRLKVGFDFITFLTPEASHAVCAYLEYRNRTVKTTRKNRIQQVGKQKIISDNDYLFISRCIPNEYLKTRSEDLRKLKHQTLMKLFRTISEKSRKDTPLGAWNLIRSHNIRKYFCSALLNAGADSFDVEFWMGHTLDDTKAAYFRASPNKLREIYCKFVPYITIQKEADISESPEYQRIKQENQILQSETARHIVERKELQELRAELEAEKAGKAALKSEIIKELLDAFELNELKIKDFSGELYTDEQIDEMNKPENQLEDRLHTPSSAGLLRGLKMTPEELEAVIPESNEEIIRRILKPDSKANENKS